MLPGVTATPPGKTPLDLLGAIGTTTAELRPGLRLVEIYTLQRMLKLMWFGDPASPDVVMLLPGAMGGFAGAAGAAYFELGDRCAAKGRGAIAVDYRKPGDLDRSLLDVCAAVDWSMREGGRRFVTVGHSFGGAVAIQTGATLGAHCVGIVTLSTQSAGCEVAATLDDTPLLLIHGDQDTILGPENSAMVAQMAGKGDLRIVQGAGHGLQEARDELIATIDAWLDDRFAA